MPRTVNNGHMGWLKWVFDACLDLIFPPHCVGCNREGAIWCQDCIRDIVTISGKLCMSCGLPLQAGAMCASCQTENLPFQLRSYAWYLRPLNQVLVYLKYRPDRRLSAWLANRLVEIVVAEEWPSMIVIPVPLSRIKIKRRGYNQVDLIASDVALKLGLPYQENALCRIKDTQSQVGLSSRARRRNVQGAFEADRKVVSGENILIIDDLCTTGATLFSCSDALLHAGARNIFALTIARAKHSGHPLNT